MDTPILTAELLENIFRPAFLVKDGTIRQANTAAAQLGFLPDSPVSAMICAGSEEYAQLTSGRLCLTLSVNGTHYLAVIFCNGSDLLFCLDPDVYEAELKALALVAQQLREPLSNALLGTGALLPDEHLRDLPDVQLQLAKINQNLYRLHRALCNMSDVGQFATPRLTKAEYRNASALFDEYLEKAATYLEHSGHAISYTGTDHPISTVIDAEKLERAVLNLLSNAAKFSVPGTTITASLRNAGNKLYFSVCTETKDPEQPIGNLFSQFLRNPGLESPENGIGLGLSIVRKAVAAHGGTLLVDRVQDTGIRFTISLPIVSPKDHELRAPTLRPGDYAGGYDHTLLELSDILPPELYR